MLELLHAAPVTPLDGTDEQFLAWLALMLLACVWAGFMAHLVADTIQFFKDLKHGEK